MSVDFDSECFFIAPIGEDDSGVRKRSDGVRDWIVKPAAAASSLRTVRADDVGEPGQITAQAVQHCLKAKAAVADLTGGNPNVYYELSVRHGALLPVVLIAEEGTRLPFDISQSRVIFFDHTDLRSSGEAKEKLQAQIEASLTGVPDNPISDGMRLAQLQAGNAEEQTLALIMGRLERITMTSEDVKEILRHQQSQSPIGVIDRERLRLSRSEEEELVQQLLREKKVQLRDGLVDDGELPSLNDVELRVDEAGGWR
jgi:hypothetical protein